MQESKKYKLNKKDGLKILKGLGIAMVGALLTFVTETIPNVDWGAYTPIVVAVSSSVVNFAWKWLQGKK